jgi:anti-sigma regulatory factor (Ser/Thr protein kinase)
VRRFASVLGENAVKFGGEGPIQLHMGLSGDRLRVEVVDQGSGFQAKRR